MHFIYLNIETFTDKLLSNMKISSASKRSKTKIREFYFKVLLDDYMDAKT